MIKLYIRGLLSVILLGWHSVLTAQNVGIGTTTPSPSAQLEISSPNRGLLIPRMIKQNFGSFTLPANGLMIYDSSNNQLRVNIGTPGSPDFESVAQNLGWLLTGNTGINPFTQFVGTTTNADLGFLMNGQLAGLADSALGNTFLGYQAGVATRGNDNTAVGAFALTNNTTGFQNTALGVLSMEQNNTGSSNTAIGLEALGSNIGGSNNIAIGSSAAASNNGDNNIAIGILALSSNTGAPGDSFNGTGNVAIGGSALGGTSNSSFNTAVGDGAGVISNLGFNNVLLGAGTNINTDGAFNDIVVGTGITLSGSNQARFGNSAITSIGGFANWTNISDARVKKDMKEDVKGIDFIMRLRPLTYRLDLTGVENKLAQGKTRQTGTDRARSIDMSRSADMFRSADMSRSVGMSRSADMARSIDMTRSPDMARSIAEGEQKVYSGFVAQEVEKAARDAGYEFSGVDKPTDGDGFYGLRYGSFVVPLVKTVQEQQELIKELRRRLDALKKKLSGK